MISPKEVVIKTISEYKPKLEDFLDIELPEIQLLKFRDILTTTHEFISKTNLKKVTRYYTSIDKDITEITPKIQKLMKKISTPITAMDLYRASDTIFMTYINNKAYLTLSPKIYNYIYSEDSLRFSTVHELGHVAHAIIRQKSVFECPRQYHLLTENFANYVARKLTGYTKRDKGGAKYDYFYPIFEASMRRGELKKFIKNLF